MPQQQNLAKSWFIWGVGAGVYLLAVFHRSSLGVAGPAAQDRFQLTSGQLASFVMLQLGVYAGMQIPAGVLIDRFGPRRMLLVATLIMGSAQLAFAVVPSYPLALLARGLLGCGDAMTYISVLRLVASWFPGQRYPILTSLTGLFGVLGNVIATVPLAAALPWLGWQTTFLIAGALSIGYAVVLLRPTTVAPFRTEPAQQSARSGAPPKPRVFDEVKGAWRLPASRLGFWVHFTTMSGPTVFATLWGFPYLTGALGLPRATASSLLLLLVISQLVFSLTVGAALGRRPVVRTPIAFIVSILCLLCWLVLISWPGGHPPVPVLVVVMIALAVGGPASMVAFMLARDYNPRHRISTATGLVNTGGFMASVIGVFLIGQILDFVEPGVAVKSATAFRWAFLAVFAVTAFGLFRLTVWWLRVRSDVLVAMALGNTTPIRIRRHRFDLVVEAQAGEAIELPGDDPDDEDENGQSPWWQWWDH